MHKSIPRELINQCDSESNSIRVHGNEPRKSSFQEQWERAIARRNSKSFLMYDMWVSVKANVDGESF